MYLLKCCICYGMRSAVPTMAPGLAFIGRTQRFFDRSTRMTALQRSPGG